MQQDTGNSMAQIEMQQSIQDCMNCASVCIQTAKSCQEAGGEHGKPEHVHMLEDCADICHTAAHFMQHNSPLYGYVTQAAASVATHCGEECDAMGDTDCANACKNAASSLEQVNKLVSF